MYLCVQWCFASTLTMIGGNESTSRCILFIFLPQCQQSSAKREKHPGWRLSVSYCWCCFIHVKRSGDVFSDVYCRISKKITFPYFIKNRGELIKPFSRIVFLRIQPILFSNDPECFICWKWRNIRSHMSVSSRVSSHAVTRVYLA